MHTRRSAWLVGLRRTLPALLAISVVGPMGLVGPASAAPVRAAAAAVPATPIDVHATNGYSSISLTWKQPSTGPRPDHFRVYEGDTVVARNTTTFATIDGLGFLSSHTFRVTAVAADGTESPASVPISHSVFVSGAPPMCVPVPHPRPRILALSASAVSLGWDRSSQPVQYHITGAGQSILTSQPQVRLGGLAPTQTYTITVTQSGCAGTQSGSIDVTTPQGPAQRPAQPAGVTVSARTDSSVTLSWAAPTDTVRVRSYAIYRGVDLVASTTGRSVRFTGLWRGQQFPITVAAIGVDGAESVHSAPIVTGPAGCDDRPPAPESLTARAVSASTIELRWSSRTQASSYTVLDGRRVIATVQTPSAMVTGLPSASRHRFRVRAQLPGSCGETPASRRATATTMAGPQARPGAPTNLRQAPNTAPMHMPSGTVAVYWDPPAGTAPVGYRVYEGATVIGTATYPVLWTVLPPASVHQLTVVAFDAAGNESAPSDPVTVTAFYLPLP